MSSAQPNQSISASDPASLQSEKSSLKPRPGPAPVSPSEIPDGGINAYLQVLGAHFLFLNSWGLVNTFGVFQDYYESALLTTSSSSAISWIGTLQGFLLIVVGILTGPLFDRGYFRQLIFTGAFLVVFGMMMTSLCETYYQVILAQGLCVGVGSGCLFVPSVAIVATYFTSKRALMTGITAAGGSIGGIVFPIVFRHLQPRIGFPWAARVIGFIVLGTMCVSLAIMKMRAAPPKEARALLDWTAFKEAPYDIFSLGLFIAFIGFYFPFFYASIYGQRVAGLSKDTSFYLLAVLNAGSIFGRIITGLLADGFGPLNVLVPCISITAVLAFVWIGISNAPGLWVFCVFYGLFSGGIVSLPSTVIATLSPDMSVVGTRMGMSFTFAGFGLLIGNPIAGAILDVAEGKFLGAQAFSAATIMGGALLILVIRLMHWRTHRGWKA